MAKARITVIVELENDKTVHFCLDRFFEVFNFFDDRNTFDVTIENGDGLLTMSFVPSVIPKFGLLPKGSKPN